MKSLLLAIDQGTTGSTAILLDSTLHVLAKHNTEFDQIYPKPGWVEHDPEAIWRSVEEAVEKAIEKAQIDPINIAAIGITNQRETTVIWDRKTNQPIYNAIVWQCRRTHDHCETLKRANKEAFIRKKTGLVLDPYFSGTKIAWILNHVEGARTRAENGELAFGTIDSFLAYRLTQGVAHVTDISNASRTMLMDLKTGAWDDELLSLLEVPKTLLPEIKGNAEIIGKTRGLGFLPDGIPIAGMAGDQQAALFGQACFSSGEAKCTFGTGAFLLLNTGKQMILSEHGLLTTAAWKLDNTITYALEGSAFIAGAAVQWLRDGMQIIEQAADIEALAKEVESSDGVVVVPAFTGLGAPHWNSNAKGIIWGITRGTTKAHIARAVLESIALQNVDLLSAMTSDLGEKLKHLRVDGGASANNLLMTIQAGLLNTPLSRPVMLETTALGAALLAGLGAGIFKDLTAIREAWREDQRFEPKMDPEERNVLLNQWKEGLKRV